MTPTSQPPFALSLEATDFASMPAPLALNLAKQLLDNGRPDDALQIALITPFELSSNAPDNIFSAYSSIHLLSTLTEQALLIASTSSSDGLSQLLSAMEARDSSSYLSTRLFSSDSMPEHFTLAHRARASEALSTIAQSNPKDALELLRRAPRWLCLHTISGNTGHRGGTGLSEALDGRWPLELSEAYFERDSLCERMADGHESSLDSLRLFTEQTLCAFDPILDKDSVPALTLLMSRCIDFCAKNQGLNKHSPLPSKWMSALMLGAFNGGRSMALNAFGHECCITAARQEVRLSSASAKAFGSGSIDAIRSTAQTLGPSEMLFSLCGKLEKSAVVLMASSMSSSDFGQALDYFVEQGASDALAASCAHRFWVVFERHASVRKMGDALAFCAAEGLMEHAELLLKKMPNLNRTSVKDVLAYMILRDSTKKNISHSAWEALLLREICNTTAAALPVVPRRSSRL